MSLATAAAGDENPNILPEVKEIKIQFLLRTPLFNAGSNPDTWGAEGGGGNTLCKGKTHTRSRLTFPLLPDSVNAHSLG